MAVCVCVRARIFFSLMLRTYIPGARWGRPDEMALMSRWGLGLEYTLDIKIKLGFAGVYITPVVPAFPYVRWSLTGIQYT